MLWAAAIAIFLGTAFGLPRLVPEGPRTGCYLTDALVIYVECGPEVRAGGLLAGVSNAAWALVIYSWFMVALASSMAAKSPAWALIILGWFVFTVVTLIGATTFAVSLRRRLRSRGNT